MPAIFSVTTQRVLYVIVCAFRIWMVTFFPPNAAPRFTWINLDRPEPDTVTVFTTETVGGACGGVRSTKVGSSGDVKAFR